MIKLVVFDWNGVLIADLDATIEVEKKVFEMFGLTPIDKKTYQETFTMPVKDFFIASGMSKEKVEREAMNIQKVFHSLYEPRIANVRTRTGARKLLEYLKAKKIDAVILSNHTIEGITAQLERLKLEEYFSSVVANDQYSTMHGKNKKEKFTDIVRASGLRASEVLIIGDSPEETEAGKAVGATTVAITGGYYSARRLKAAKPDYLIHSLTKMIAIIQAL